MKDYIFTSPQKKIIIECNQNNRDQNEMIENMSTADFILYWLDVFAMSNGFRNEQLLLVNMLDTANAPVDNSE